jgi:hypothetical protein
MVPSAKASFDQQDARVVSLADYRRKRLARSDDDSTPPPPCPVAARPIVERARVETRSSPFWHTAPQLRQRRTN